MDGKLPNTIPADFNFSGNVRRYYISAEQAKWNYAPSGWDNWLGVPIGASPRASSAGYTAPGSLGLRWEKAFYFGYTDATFSTQVPKSSTQGSQGPTLRAEVGDMIEILFVNKLTNNYASMHSMGLAYSKQNEGSLYPNYTAQAPVDRQPPVGSGVPPGGCYVYKWLINDGSAPTQGAASHMWGYHSFVTMQEDLNAGLVGPTIVYSRGKMNSTMASNREFTLMYMQYDESNSFLSDTNAQQMLGITNTSSSVSPVPALGQGYGNYSIWHPQITNLLSSGKLSPSQAPTFSTLNGLVFANNNPFEMCAGDSVIWYVVAYGNNPHVFHMHGNGFVYQGMNMASISINAGVMRTLPMTANGVGLWQLICHISNHDAKGMEDNYIVYPNGSCPLPKLAT